MDAVFYTRRMAVNLKEIGKKISNMELENIIFKMALLELDNGKVEQE